MKCSRVVGPSFTSAYALVRSLSLFPPMFLTLVSVFQTVQSSLWTLTRKGLNLNIQQAAWAGRRDLEAAHSAKLRNLAHVVHPNLPSCIISYYLDSFLNTSIFAILCGIFDPFRPWSHQSHGLRHWSKLNERNLTCICVPSHFCRLPFKRQSPGLVPTAITTARHHPHQPDDDVLGCPPYRLYFRLLWHTHQLNG